MQPITKYEKEILNEISGLPEHLQIKLSRIISFMKKEMLEDYINEPKATNALLGTCGKWKDIRSAKEQVEDIYSQRKSTNRTENIF